MKGFDVSALTKAVRLSIWVDFIEGVRVKMRYLSREDLKQITQKCTTTRFDSKTHQKVEEIDWDKWHEEVGLAAVEEWDGLCEGDAVYPCTPDNIRIMVASWAEFRKFVGDLCVDLETMVRAEKEAARKNSETGSALATTTQA